ARVLDFRDDLFGNFLVAIEEMEQFLADTIDEVGADFRVAKLVFGLRFEDSVLEADRDSSDHALADVVALEFLAAVLVDGFEQPLPKGAEVRAAVASVLAVYERIESFAVPAVAMREAELEHFFRVMERGVDRFAAVRL